MSIYLCQCPREASLFSWFKDSFWSLRNSLPLWCCCWDLCVSCWKFTGKSPGHFLWSSQDCKAFPEVPLLGDLLWQSLASPWRRDSFSSTLLKKLRRLTSDFESGSSVSSLLPSTLPLSHSPDVCVSLTFSSSSLSGSLEPFGVLLFLTLIAPKPSVLPLG